MSSTLILSIAGKSTRYPGVRPKGLLTHPNGNPMVIESFSNLDLSQYDNIILIALQEQEDKYQFAKSFRSYCDIFLLPEPVANLPTAVAYCIEQLEITGSIHIKDTDNTFEGSFPTDRNCIAYMDLHDAGTINAANKSYITLSTKNLVDHIVEKQVISPYFNTGLYGFKHAQQFVNVYQTLSDNENLYTSDIIYKMLLNGSEFEGIKCSNYEDWGTLEDWHRYTSTYKTLFVDIDGVLVQNSGEWMPPYWGTTDAIQDNVDYLNELHKTGKYKIILTTSRSRSFELDTKHQLQRIGLHYDDIVYDLLHSSERILINDFAKTNPHPSASALSIPRNSNNLRDYL